MNESKQNILTIYMDYGKPMGSPVTSLALQAPGGEVTTKKFPIDELTINLNSPRNFQFYTG